MDTIPSGGRCGDRGSIVDSCSGEETETSIRQPKQAAQGGEPDSPPDGCVAGGKVSWAKIRKDSTLGSFYNYYRDTFSEKPLQEGYDKDDPAFNSQSGMRSSRLHQDLDENML